MEKKTKKEIKRAMSICCNSANCAECPYWAHLEKNEYSNDECVSTLIKDALNEIEKLEQQNEKLKEERDLFRSELSKETQQHRNFVLKAEKQQIKARLQELISLRATLIGIGLNEGRLLEPTDYCDEINRRIGECQSLVAKRKDKQ